MATVRLATGPRAGRRVRRVRLIDADHLTFRLKTPWSDGTTHLVLSPLERIEKLAALVPPPRLNLVRYHGILAPMPVFVAWLCRGVRCCRTLHRWGSLRIPPLVVA